jgi:hypothetical protein
MVAPSPPALPSSPLGTHKPWCMTPTPVACMCLTPPTLQSTWYVREGTRTALELLMLYVGCWVTCGDLWMTCEAEPVHRDGQSGQRLHQLRTSRNRVRRSVQHDSLVMTCIAHLGTACRYTRPLRHCHPGPLPLLPTLEDLPAPGHLPLPPSHLFLLHPPPMGTVSIDMWR